MAMVLNDIIFNMSYLYYYYHANIHSMVTIFFKLTLKKLWGKFIQCRWQHWIFSPFEGATTSLKPIYKCCEWQWFYFFHSSLKVPQISSNLTSVVDNDRFWTFQIFLNYLLSSMTMGFLNKLNFNFRHLN
jgi:hypothetical protein